MTSRYARHPDLRLTALEGEGVVLHLGERRYFTVSETGLAVLEALIEPRTLDQLVEAITDVYDVERGHAEASVQAFLARCLDSSLVRLEET